MGKKSKPKTSHNHHHKYLDELIHQSQQKIKRHKFKTPIIITFFLFLLLCYATIGLLNFKNSQITAQPPPPQLISIPTEETTADWIKYTYPEFGISFEKPENRPKNCGIKTYPYYDETNKVLRIMPGEPCDYTFQVEIHDNSTNISLEKFAESYSLPGFSRVLKRENLGETKLNNKTGVLMQITYPIEYGNGEIIDTNLFFLHKRKVVLIRYEPNSSNLESRRLLKNLNNQILSTFKFIDPAPRDKFPD